MGQVFRARDTKLNRDVALKVLPDGFELDSDPMARFTREAHMLAALNHPNIAAIYGLEDSQDRHALILELGRRIDHRRHDRARSAGARRGG
jgi:serine/threonine-protein kinase